MTAPQFRVGLSGSVQVVLPASTVVWARWGFWRDQALCDTCKGEGPGWVGDELLGSSDAYLAVQRRFLLGEGPTDELADSPWLAARATSSVPWLVLRADTVLPASRDALVCNPMVAAPGAGALFGIPAGQSTLQLGVSASRPLHTHRAAPVGKCAPPLTGENTVRTLTGAVAPTPWNGDRSGASNPIWTANAQAVWANPHALIDGSPDALFTSLSLGLSAIRVNQDPPAAVASLTGPVLSNASNNPVRTGLPWSIQAGLSASDHVDVSLSLTNRLPTLSADPMGLLRAQPTTTVVTASLAGRF